jgi:hypothetical protein
VPKPPSKFPSEAVCGLQSFCLFLRYQYRFHHHPSHLLDGQLHRIGLGSQNLDTEILATDPGLLWHSHLTRPKCNTSPSQSRVKCGVHHCKGLGGKYVQVKPELCRPKIAEVHSSQLLLNRTGSLGCSFLSQNTGLPKILILWLGESRVLGFPEY